MPDRSTSGTASDSASKRSEARVQALRAGAAASPSAAAGRARSSARRRGYSLSTPECYACGGVGSMLARERFATRPEGRPATDRKSTRLNSSHVAISYAVFCLKKKKENQHRG